MSAAGGRGPDAGNQGLALRVPRRGPVPKGETGPEPGVCLRTVADGKEIKGIPKRGQARRQRADQN